MVSPSRRRATKRRRSSITELAFHGIHTSRLQKSEKCNPCVRYKLSPMSRAAHKSVEAQLPGAVPHAVAEKTELGLLCDQDSRGRAARNSAFPNHLAFQLFRLRQLRLSLLRWLQFGK